MRRALVLLALLAIHASAEDAAALCDRLSSEAEEERAAAAAQLRLLGAEADAPLASLESSDRPGAALAGAVRAARRWDPERTVDDLEIFQQLASAEQGQRVAGFTRVVLLGSARAGAVARRVLDSFDGWTRDQLISSLGNGPGRDRGWAREALRWSRAPEEGTRSSAAWALSAHAGREHVGDVRIWLEREPDPSTRARLWQVLAWITASPADLPALPANPEEYAAVLELLAGGNSMEFRQLAWRAARKRLPSPLSRAFLQDPVRVQGMLGIDACVGLFEFGSRPSAMPLDMRRRLGISPRPEARALAAMIEDLSPLEISRAAMFLDDPDYSVRLATLQSLDRWERTGATRSENERLAAFARFGAAVRTLLDAAAGAEAAPDSAWAVRYLLREGGPSATIAATAYQALWTTRSLSSELLRPLEDDKDAGPAAKRIRRLLQLGIPPQGVSLNRGLDSPARVRSGWIPALDLDVWRALVASNDGEEKQLGVSLMGDAWDRMDLRAEIAEDLVKLAADPDAAASQQAIAILSSWSPDRIPEKADLDPREVWYRSRTYVLPRLRAALAPQTPLDRQRAAVLQSHGDRALLLAALRAGRYDQPATEMFLLQRPGEPGLLPIFLQRIEALEAPLTSVPWLAALAACSPEGTRIVAALARQGTRATRPAALATLLMRPWSDFAAEPIVEAAAVSADPAERSVLLQALRLQPGRNRPAYSPRLAESIAALLLRMEKDPADRADLEALVAGLGESLAQVSDATMTALANNKAIAAIARASGVEFSAGSGSIEAQIFAGDRATRNRALSRLPAASLRSVRTAVASWLVCGNLYDYTELYTLDRSNAEADAALLVWAAEDPLNREELLRMRRLIGRWSYYRPAVAGDRSWRIADAEEPREFRGGSARARSRAAGRVGDAPSAEFAALCAAAFHGCRGDEIALQAVLPRLGPDALPRLAPLLNAKHDAIRSMTARAFGRLGGKAPAFACAALRVSLEGESHRGARAAKLAALQRLGDAAAPGRLGDMAASPDPDERLAAALALPAAGNRGAAAILAGLALDGDFRIRDAAETGLQRLTRRVWPPDVRPWEPRGWSGWLEANPEAPLFPDDGP